MGVIVLAAVLLVWWLLRAETREDEAEQAAGRRAQEEAARRAQEEAGQQAEPEAARTTDEGGLNAP